MHHVTVGVRLAVHVVALDDALEAAALDGADDVDHLAGGELLDGDDVADLGDVALGVVGEADLVEMAVGATPALRRWPTSPAERRLSFWAPKAIWTAL